MSCTEKFFYDNEVPITVAHGDGIGPEVLTPLSVLKGASLAIDIGVSARQQREDRPAPEQSLRRTKVFLKAPIPTPQAATFRTTASIRTGSVARPAAWIRSLRWSACPRSDRIHAAGRATDPVRIEAVVLNVAACGVGMGALRNTLVRRKDCSGAGRSSRCCRADTPMSIARLAPFRTESGVRTSGPIPSPWATVMGTSLS